MSEQRTETVTDGDTDLDAKVMAKWNVGREQLRGVVAVWVYTDPELGLGWASQPVLMDRVKPSQDLPAPATPEEALATGLYTMGAVPSDTDQEEFVVALRCKHTDGRENHRRLAIKPGESRQSIATRLSGVGVLG